MAFSNYVLAMSRAMLKAGDTAPPFEAKADSGDTIRLSALAGKRVILYFYPKDDTPGCTAQACDFRDRQAALQKKNVVVLGVSPNDESSHRKFKSKYNLNFPLLIDADHQIAEAYGVWGEKTNYGKKYMGIIRSHFVIDENGKILDARYNVAAKESADQAQATALN